jgi:CDGSH iron-sulfur domain-containing protein 3
MQAKIAVKQPSQQKLEADKKYFWCACGHSQTQPFCDGTHKSVNQSLPEGEMKFKPVVISFSEPETKWLCQCKHTQSPPYCDGTHKTL